MGGAWTNLGGRVVGASQRIFCRIGKDDFGIPLLTRMMSEFGFRGTYFVEMFAADCLGESDLKPVFEFLLRERQDVQLHVHPVFRQYAEYRKARDEGQEYRGREPLDLIGEMDANEQMELMREAVDRFEAFAGHRPVVFRAGCFAASRATLDCLRRLGILVDSSFNPCYPQISFPDERLEPNRVQNIAGVWEIPVTVARTRLPEGYNGYKFADCTSLSFPEIRSMLETAANAGQKHFVIVFHSFSAVKAKDESYAEMRPNRIVIGRLEKLFRYLARHSDEYQVETMGGIARCPDALEEESAAPAMARLGLVQAAGRKAVQWLNNSYWI